MDDKDKSQLDMRFPTKGIDITNGAFDQRPGTTPLGINVRGFDTDLRLRGGSRPGLTPWLGAGSTVQVSGFNPIQHLACVVTASMDALIIPRVLFATPEFVISYSEVNSPPSRDAPVLTKTGSWFTPGEPTITITSGVVVGTPDGGGTGMATSSYKFSTDGTTVTIVGTFISAGFPGPYFYSGPPQVVTKTISQAAWLPPATGVVTFTWAVVAGSFIAQHTVDVRAV